MRLNSHVGEPDEKTCDEHDRQKPDVPPRLSHQLEAWHMPDSFGPPDA